MAFDRDAPTAGQKVKAAPVRGNFQALAQHHRSTTAPAGAQTGYIWWDASDAQNEKLKRRYGNNWAVLFEHMESTPVPVNSDQFTELLDTPASYTGAAGKTLVVNAGGTGVEFGTPLTGLDQFTELLDTPASYTGAAGAVPMVNTGATGLQFNYLAAEQTEYLVGPAGTAKYSTIQAAIDAAVADGYDNDNHVDVWVMPGTYVEDLSLPPGVNIRALYVQPGLTTDNPTNVVVDGTVTINKDDAGATTYNYTLQGLELHPTVGSTKNAVVESGTAKKIVLIDSSYVKTEDADTLTFGGTSPVAQIKFVKSTAVVQGASTTIATIPANVTIFGYDSSFTTLWFDAAARIVELDGGKFTFFGTLAQSANLLGTIEVLATGAGSQLTMQDGDWDLILQPAHVIVGAALSNSSYRNVTASGSPIVVTGAQANTFGEVPSTDSGSLWVYKDDGTNAKQFVLAQLAAAQTDYLVGPAGTAKYSTIQAAIDAAVAAGMTGDNPMTVWVLDGTYNENLTLYAGLTIQSVTFKHANAEYVLDTPSVVVTGTVTLTNNASPAAGVGVNLYGLNINAPSGSSALTVTSSTLTFIAMTIMGCKIKSTNADMFSITKGSAFGIVVTTVLCFLETDNGRLIRIQSGATLSLKNCRVLIGTATRAAVLAGGSFQVQNDDPRGSSNTSFDAPIEVETGSTLSTLILASMSLSQNIETYDVLVEGTLSSASYYTEDCVNTRTKLPIIVSGTNANNLTAQPGVHARYDYLVSPAGGGGRFTTIQAAIDAANATSPASEEDAITVHVLDDSEYDEDLTHYSYVNVYAPHATLKGTQTLAANMTLTARRLTNDGANNVIVKSSAGVSTVVAHDGIASVSGADTVSFTNGTLHLKTKSLSNNTEDLIVMTAGTTLYIDVVQSVIPFGKIGISNTGGTVYGTLGQITGAPTTSAFVLSTAASMYLSATYVGAATAYNVDATSTLRLFVGKLLGAETIAVGADVRVTKAARKFVDAAAPTGGSDSSRGFDYFSEWIATGATGGDHYVCTDPTAGAAVWKKTTP